MKYLIADLIEKIADQEASKKEALVQLDALKIVVTALFAHLDSHAKEAIRDHISHAFEKLAEENSNDLTELDSLKGATLALLSRNIVLPSFPAEAVRSRDSLC
ncbi:sigma-S stabilization anti-adapter protein IraP [Leclercia adecarboxylata]|uniref:sigma-S stabilization anti-adapter protein IraP n=1 Tax=Leclercia adecarboxylata TaxID=83655 RepID=UPI0013DFC404|nr:sigma-S stabilization anti-adapter protein IraP [Leclercia adecarboxylata]MDV5275726.1 sigma-S stabilization anti-adapter protein IraP [Leclercia adecarboxylata]MDV5461690.1 sigma-S stabilization anti-adapter protein IraP [Leclercia adecarboxylata]MDV5503162.1 sigma-S stabilization anti-adapter protein IraP [Leclercia adecarboxylata]MDV5533272.1 sigma-S stabilization anti-adapter protein IraP [Leclercia adecarboxylata]MDV5562639.1 sigma-S stabilization anti-adapter protein IraP [Leclercia a